MAVVGVVRFVGLHEFGVGVLGGADRVIRRWDAIAGKALTSTLPERDIVAEAVAGGERGAVVFVGEAGDGAAGVELIRSVDPDVALVDLSMPVLDGLGVLSRLRQSATRTKVLLVTTFDDEQAMLKATALGAHGFLLKDLGRGDLEAAIKAVTDIYKSGLAALKAKAEGK